MESDAHIKYSKSALWLRPYVRAVRKLIPIERIKSIRGYKVALGLVERGAAKTKEYRKKVNITIRLWSLDDDKAHHSRNRYEDVLVFLGHELAHLIHWEHTPDHFKLLSRVMLRFVKVLEKEGITDTSKRFHLKIMKKHIEKSEQSGTLLS